MRLGWYESIQQACGEYAGLKYVAVVTRHTINCTQVNLDPISDSQATNDIIIVDEIDGHK